MLYIKFKRYIGDEMGAFVVQVDPDALRLSALGERSLHSTVEKTNYRVRCAAQPN